MNKNVNINDYYVIADNKFYQLMEHKKYGDEIGCIIVSKRTGNVVKTNVWNGFEELTY